MKPIKMYAVYSPYNGILPYSVKQTADESKGSVMSMKESLWSELEAQHYRLIVVSVNLLPEKP